MDGVEEAAVHDCCTTGRGREVSREEPGVRKWIGKSDESGKFTKINKFLPELDAVLVVVR